MFQGICLAQLSSSDFYLFGLLVFVCFLGMIAIFYFGWWLNRAQTCPCPYTGLPLRYASDLPYVSKERILCYVHDLKSYDNRLFDLRKAAYCRDTGRVFPNSVSWFDTIHVDWKFIQKKLPGNYVSWGSLNSAQQRMIREAHITLEGFQTEISSPSPLPRAIEQDYSYEKPGPLYVDLETKVLLGWKEVSGSEFEVLIVQRPVKPHVYNLPKELKD